MSNVQIFVEGVTDQKFLQDIVEEWYGIKLTLGNLGKPSGDIISLDGKDAFDTPKKLHIVDKLFEYLAKTNKQAIVLFDADIFHINQARLAQHSEHLNFNYFLFPDHQRNGEIETLLEEIICVDNQVIFDCWKDFENCLKQHNTPSTLSGKFTTPANKTKIYAYVETLVGETDSEKEKIKDRNRDYRNKSHWNLDPNHPPLKPLKEFLDPYFSTQ
ncbi:DUF3226 domain-containing protein [Spirosoma litoris]